MHIFIASNSYSMPLNLETTIASKFQASPFGKHIMAPVRHEDQLELEKFFQEMTQGISTFPLCFRTSPVFTAIHPSPSFYLITLISRKVQH